MLVIDIDDRGCTGRQQFLKQPQLGSEIRIEVRMIVEMIARDVGECRRGKVQAIEPVLIEPMRRSFDREMADAIAGQGLKRAMQLDRVGCGQCAVAFAARRNDTNCADARGLVAVRRPDLPRERCHRSFAARPGDGGNGTRLASEEFRRD